MMLSSLTNAINAALRLDPESGKRIRKLQGKTISIELLPFHFKFECLFDESGLHLSQNEILPVDVSLRGTPLQLLGVMLTRQNRHHFFAEDLVMDGNAETGQQVVDLFDHLHIDWEEQLSRLIGDIPAHHAANMIKKFNAFLDDSRKSICDNINEYVHEEAKWLPSREALNDFFSDIDLLRMDVDRIEAKMKMVSEK